MAQAEIILLEDIYKLGGTGDIVKVRPGYARNFLLPQGKALRVNKGNLALFEAKKADLEKQSQEKKEKAEKLSKKLDGKIFSIIEQASEKGILYGAVTATLVHKHLSEKNFLVTKDAIQLKKPIKSTGVYAVDVLLHPMVRCNVQINVASSAEVAEIQIRKHTAIDSVEEEKSDEAEKSL